MKFLSIQNKYWLHLTFALLLIFAACSNRKSVKQNSASKFISVQEYQESVYASWLGQIIGNTYGLCYEFQFIEEPGPNKFPYGYTWTLDELAKYDGAFSDDDTDIEYMYLIQMEKHEIEPSYFTLAEAWKTHIKERIWCANRVALNLMLAGHYPPVTGSKEYNPQWMQIDPQLINEIWAVTAPGMIDYAVTKSEFAARITNDSFGIEPTLHYAAMYSAAFFEKDIAKLIDIGTAAIGVESRFGKIVEHVKKLYSQYPQDWQMARKIVKDNYLVYQEYNKYAWPPIDANLNGAFGIMALLYGEGDFQKTLDYSCAFGMDADNQAASMCGLLGIVNGLHSIPEDLMFPLEDSGWEEPFNDVYKMVTREGLPDASIKDQTSRMAAIGEKLILAHGGEIVEKDGNPFYRINPDAVFTPPFELNTTPEFYVEKNRAFTYPIYTGGKEEEVELSLKGQLPEGVGLIDRKLSGSPKKEGTYRFEIIAERKGEKKVVDVLFHVFSENLAPAASEIVFNANAINKNIEIIRDGLTTATYYSTKKGDKQEVDFYGYIWDEPQLISALSFNNGVPQEYCGWFLSFDVEYLENGQWKKMDNFKIYPELNLENSQWLKANLIDYSIQFETINTNGIRISGLAGGIEKDAGNAHLGMQFYTSISELRVFSQ